METLKENLKKCTKMGEIHLLENTKKRNRKFELENKVLLWEKLKSISADLGLEFFPSSSSTSADDDSSFSIPNNVSLSSSSDPLLPFNDDEQLPDINSIYLSNLFHMDVLYPPPSLSILFIHLFFNSYSNLLFYLFY